MDCLQMYSTSRGFIVTQNPLPTTVVDFYRLLYEKNPAAIVSFNDEIGTEVTCKIFGQVKVIMINNNYFKAVPEVK